MLNGIHFIAGLPRAGSTLLAALLRQNPHFHAGMTSPVGGLVTAMMREASGRNETAVFISDAQRERLLRAIFDAYYGDIHPTRLVFDTNRMWTTKLPVLDRLFPQARVICCVRNPAWIIDSFERLVRRNALQPSGIFDFDPGGTVYSRAEGLSAPNGLAGFAWNALREAVFGAFPEKLLLVRYESLTADPLGTLAAVYRFIGSAPFPHVTTGLQSAPAELAFDSRLGTPGLHAVGAVVQAAERTSILPPDLFERFEAEAFWDEAGGLPAGVAII